MPYSFPFDNKASFFEWKKNEKEQKVDRRPARLSTRLNKNPFLLRHRGCANYLEFQSNERINQVPL